MPASYRLFLDGKHIVPRRKEAVIGRHSDCDVCIDSPDISRKHARITVRPTGIFIEDLASKNGTWVGADRVDMLRALRDGDRIRVGDTTLIFRSGLGDDSTASAG